MRKFVLSFAILMSVLLPLAAQSKPAQKPASDAGDKSEIAILFNFTNLTAVATPYNDGFQTGAGLKYRFNEKIAVRALLSALVQPVTTTTSKTNLGISAAGEFHLRPGKVSPYLGAVLGCAMLIETNQTYLDFFGGALGGVELRFFENLSFYAEYQALLSRTVDGFAFHLGDRVGLGFAIYL